jgi:hypothetical protein
MYPAVESSISFSLAEDFASIVIFWWRQWDFMSPTSPWMASHKISPWMMSHDEWCALNDWILLMLDSLLIQLLLFFPGTVTSVSMLVWMRE